jgi:NarL family two-component system response regulator LiaR
MPELKPRILVADDDADTRQILHDSLTHWGAEVVVAADGDEALRLAARQPIDIAILDVKMPGPAGMELAACLQRIIPDACAIIFTAFGTIEQAVDAMKDGAVYYLCKPCPPGRVREVVEDAWRQQLARMRFQVGDRIVDWKRGEVIVEGHRQPLEDLSRRERQVLDCLAEGCSDQEIARKLEIKKTTAKTHVRNILAKLRVKRRGQAAMIWVCYRQRHRK